MTGGLYLWKDGREVPDTMNVSLEHARRDPVHLGFRLRQQSARRHRRRAGHRRHHFARASRSATLPQKVNRPDGAEMLGSTRTAPQRAHAEFLGLHPLGQRAELPVRTGLPRVDRLPHGGGELSPAAHGALGSRRGRDRLSSVSATTANGFRIHTRTDPAAQSRAGIRRGRNCAARHGVG